ncbi:MAG: GDSL-type esterase/lipase family protein [Eubacteriales bacterium]|nr:GDSL-type esterase/lipase family protein [Eubacteriales bacterium]
MELEAIMRKQVFAVVGNTVDPSKTAAKIKGELLAHKYTVYAVGKELHSLNQISEKIDVIDLCIHPVKGLELLREFTGTCDCVVIQEGAGSPEIISWLRTHHIPFIDGCLLAAMRMYGHLSHRKKKVLCFGDSNTYGYNPYNGQRYPETIRWTGILASLLGEQYEVIEEGCNGRTTQYDTPGEEWKNGMRTIIPCLNTHKPVDIVVLALGSNDMKTIFHADASNAAAGAEKLIGMIRSFAAAKQQFQPEIILVSPPEIGEGIVHTAFAAGFTAADAQKSKAFARFYKAAADRNGCRFWNAAACTGPSDIDHLHLDPKGHRIYAQELRNIIWSIR